MTTALRLTTADRVRKALSLMAKYRMAPNPLNYALWYCHAGDTHPQLNDELNDIVGAYGTCSQDKAESLYRRHILTENPELCSIDDGLIRLTRELRGSVEEAEGENRSFLCELNTIAEELTDEMGNVELEGLVNRLILSTDSTIRSNQKLKSQIGQAEKEIQNLKAIAERYKSESQTDALTELYNRRYFQQKAGDLAAGNAGFSLILLDIDNFKGINDTYGHPFGDKVIKAMANTIRKVLPEGAYAFRMGGEEFGILIPGGSVFAAKSIAEKCRKAVESLVITNRQTKEAIGTFSASFGVTSRQASETLSDVLSRADRFLYIAKSSGKNCVKVAS